MNPLRWKLEHLIAWPIIVMLGAAIGLVLFLYQYAGENPWNFYLSFIWSTPDPGVALMVGEMEMWVIGSALFAALGFYAIQLWRR
jgi:hypothetical protein